MSDVIGAMRARVTLQSPSRTPDDVGGAALAWASQGDVWAEIVAGSASERAAFDTAPSVAGYRVIIHRRDGVRAGWRVLWGARALRIASVADEGAPRIVLNCEEERL
ncbi:MAG: phage head closure protein [Hyphomonadaceae bacterium]